MGFVFFVILLILIFSAVATMYSSDEVEKEIKPECAFHAWTVHPETNRLNCTACGKNGS